MTYLSPHGLGCLVHYLPASPTCLPAFCCFFEVFQVVAVIFPSQTIYTRQLSFYRTTQPNVSLSFFPLSLISARVCCGLIFAGVKTSLSSSLLRHQHRPSNATILPAAGVCHPPIPHTDSNKTVEGGGRRVVTGADWCAGLLKPPLDFGLSARRVD